MFYIAGENLEGEAQPNEQWDPVWPAAHQTIYQTICADRKHEKPCPTTAPAAGDDVVDNNGAAANVRR